MFDWVLIEESAGEQLWAAKISGGLLLKFVVLFKMNSSASVTFVPGVALRQKKDGAYSIVKGK